METVTADWTTEVLQRFLDAAEPDRRGTAAISGPIQSISGPATPGPASTAHT